MENKPFIIDITGNWRDTNSFLPFIQTREPWLEDKKPKAFIQELKLTAGKYAVKFEYETFLDKRTGGSIGDEYYNFQGFKVNGQIKSLKFSNRNHKESHFYAECKFEIFDTISSVSFELHLYNTRVMRTWIDCAQQVHQSHSYKAISPSDQGEYLVTHGIPFMVSKLDSRFFGANFESLVQGLDRGSLLKWNDGMRVECYGAKVKTAHFLGMIHNIDIGNGSWYSAKGDDGFSHFVGDKVGEIIIEWMDGDKFCVPLIFGFNIWFGRPWDMNWHYSPYAAENTGYNHDDKLFCGKHEYREIIQDGVMLVDGVRIMGSNSCNARYVFSLELEERAVKALEIKGVDTFYDYPLISGITLETESISEELGSLPEICCAEINAKLVNLNYIEKRSYLTGVEKIMHVFYTFDDDYPKINKPVIPIGYFGPDFDFQGTQDAIYAATYLYRNGPENAAYIADSGTECRSSTANEALHHYTLGMGVWIEWPSLFGSIQNWFRLYKEREPGNLPGCNQAWTRGVGELLREAMAFGYDKFITSYVNWLDRALFDEANPPHWNRLAGAPEACTYKIRVGDTEERGNRENDGHGICMWGRYMMWHWMGRSLEWNKEHWGATEASVEWIQWQLDNDTVRPGVRKDVLFTESECAYSSYEIYSSYNCLHGIKLAIRMAEQLEKDYAVKRWTILYEKLRKGILDNLVDESEFGPIWHTYSETDWQDHAHKLVHIFLATEGDTYTPLQDYATGDYIDRHFMEVSLNSYRFLMKDKNYNCLRMFGYGQGMMTQSALLLDEMEDAGHFLHNLLRHCYLPKLSGWASPEGIIVHPEGKYYIPVNGYRGQDSHLADSTKAARLMLGVDDNDPEHLRFVPRYPEKWDSMSIIGYPVLTGEHRQKVDYIYKRSKDNQTFEFIFENEVKNFSLRLGPIPKNRNVTNAYLNGGIAPFKVGESGDSRWIWISELTGTSGKVTILLDYL